MEENLNYGVIIRQLRKIEGLSIRDFAQKIGRSSGWLSDIENCTGRCRVPTQEFHRIVEALGASKHRSMFRTWVANSMKFDHVDRSLEGAVLKFVRIRKNLTLEQVARKVGLSECQLSKLENGHRPPSVELRKSILLACGYSPASFKNFYSDPERSKVVPASYKLNILLKRLPEEKVAEILAFTQNLIEGGAK